MSARSPAFNRGLLASTLRQRNQVKGNSISTVQARKLLVLPGGEMELRNSLERDFRLNEKDFFEKQKGEMKEICYQARASLEFKKREKQGQQDRYKEPSPIGLKNYLQKRNNLILSQIKQNLDSMKRIPEKQESGLQHRPLSAVPFPKNRTLSTKGRNPQGVQLVIKEY